MSDPVEDAIARGLDASRLFYTREGDEDHPDGGLDFYVLGLELHIECKRFHSNRIAKQTSKFENVIVIQGMESAKFFSNLLIVLGDASRRMIEEDRA